MQKGCTQLYYGDGKGKTTAAMGQIVRCVGHGFKVLVYQFLKEPNSGEVSIIQAQVVYEHDSFNYSFGLEPVLKHIPAASDRGEPTYVYAMFRTKEGGFGFDVMSMDAVRTFAQQYSKSFSSGPWQTNFEEMAKKTVLKKVLKYAPLKSDFQRGLALDGTIKADVGEDMYAVPGTVLEVDSETGEVTEVGPEA